MEGDSDPRQSELNQPDQLATHASDVNLIIKGYIQWWFLQYTTIYQFHS